MHGETYVLRKTKTNHNLKGVYPRVSTGIFLGGDSMVQVGLKSDLG